MSQLIHFKLLSCKFCHIVTIWEFEYLPVDLPPQFKIFTDSHSARSFTLILACCFIFSFSALFFTSTVCAALSPDWITIGSAILYFIFWLIYVLCLKLVGNGWYSGFSSIRDALLCTEVSLSSLESLSKLVRVRWSVLLEGTLSSVLHVEWLFDGTRRHGWTLICDKDFVR